MKNCVRCVFLLFSGLIIPFTTVYADQVWHTIADSTALSGRCVQAVDMDNDGDIDVVASDINNIIIYENDGSQSFEGIQIEAGTDLYGIYTGDLDGDNNLDIVVMDEDAEMQHWYRNQGDMSFVQEDLAEIYFNDAVIIDYDDDGDMDIVGTDHNGVVLLENNVDSGFTGIRLIQRINTDPFLDVADMDGDGDPDILYTGMSVNFFWYENVGEDGFIEHDLLIGLLDMKAGIKAADMNNDGMQDIIGGTFSCHIPIWTQTEEGEFSYTLIEDSFHYMQDIGIVDYNGDGFKDVVAVACSPSSFASLGVWYNLGNGTYFREYIVAGSDPFKSVASVDLDGDDDQDVLYVGGRIGGGITGWFENLGQKLFTIQADSTHYTYYFTYRGGEVEAELNVALMCAYDIHPDIWMDVISPDASILEEVILFEDLEIEHGDTVAYPLEYTVGEGIDPGLYSLDIHMGIYPDSILDNTQFGFIVGPNPPNEFSLIRPGDHRWIGHMYGYFQWEEAVDIDMHAAVRYQIWIGSEPDLSDAYLYRSSISGCQYQVPLFPQDRAYYWTVFAADINTEGTWASDTLCFTTDAPDPPGEFSLIYPDNHMEISCKYDLPLELTWSTASDPDLFDSVSYTLEICQDGLFEEDILTYSTLDTTLILDSLELNTWYWRVIATDRYEYFTVSDTRYFFVTTDAKEMESESVPDQFCISKTYPNPFNPSLAVEIAIPEAGRLQLEVYNVLGKRVAILNDNPVTAGYHEFIWQASDFASGAYFVKAALEHNESVVSKVHLLK